MTQTEAVCPSCGFDFGSTEPSPKRKGFAYSPLADVALAVGQGVAGIACVFAIIGCVVSLLHGEWFNALIQGPIAILLLLAMFVVFARTLDRS